MDVDLLKTFIAVYHARHFGRAADSLFVTPSAVSARIRLLESQLDTQLFMRDRNNIRLTPAGEKFLGYAKSMLKLWERARYEVNLGVESEPHLEILGVPSLWETMLQPCISDLRRKMPRMLLRVESMESEQIIRRLQQDKADLGFVLESREGGEFNLVDVGQFPLVLVSTKVAQTVEQVLADPGYVLVEWNTSFLSQYGNLFPTAPRPRLWVTSGPLAYGILRASGGAAYLPQALVEQSLSRGELHQVADAPVIRLRIYAAYPSWTEQEQLVQKVIETAQAYF